MLFVPVFLFLCLSLALAFIIPSCIYVLELEDCPEASLPGCFHLLKGLSLSLLPSFLPRCPPPTPGEGGRPKASVHRVCDTTPLENTPPLDQHPTAISGSHSSMSAPLSLSRSSSSSSPSSSSSSSSASSSYSSSSAQRRGPPRVALAALARRTVRW